MLAASSTTGSRAQSHMQGGRSMAKRSTMVGLDVHKDSIDVSIAETGRTGESAALREDREAEVILSFIGLLAGLLLEERPLGVSRSFLPEVVEDRSIEHGSRSHAFLRSG